MGCIPVEDHVRELVRFGAGLLGISESEFVERGAHALAPSGSRVPEDPWQPVAVYAVYEQHRVDGEFVRATRRLTIRSGPRNGQAFQSPSAAARAVVADLNPARVATQTNGWRFWHLTATGQRLAALR